MIDEWNKYKGWSVIEFFLLYPNTKIHVKELSRKLKIGPQTAQRFCNLYHAEGLLSRNIIGSVHQYSLKENEPRIMALKKFMGPYLLSDKQYLLPFLEKNKNILSISIYGSFASADYRDSSDLDVLLITGDEKTVDGKDLAKIELKLGREVGLTTIPLAKWRAMERKKDYFFLAIKRNNMLVWGTTI